MAEMDGKNGLIVLDAMIAVLDKFSGTIEGTISVRDAEIASTSDDEDMKNVRGIARCLRQRFETAGVEAAKIDKVANKYVALSEYVISRRTKAFQEVAIMVRRYISLSDQIKKAEEKNDRALVKVLNEIYFHEGDELARVNRGIMEDNKHIFNLAQAVFAIFF